LSHDWDELLTLAGQLPNIGGEMPLMRESGRLTKDFTFDIV